MKVIIAGSGDSGRHLAKLLSNENQDVVLIGSDRSVLAMLDASYNILTLTGNPLDEKVLKEAGAESADLFVAVMPGENDNLVACQLAARLGTEGCVARLERPEYLKPGIAEMFSRYGVGTMVYPEMLVAEEIAGFMQRSWVLSWFELKESRLLMTGIKIQGGCPLDGVLLRDIHQKKRNFHVVALRHQHEIIIPRGNSRIERGDVAYVTMRPESMEEIAAMSGYTPKKLDNVMISGAGKITTILLDLVSKEGYGITVIDKDREACRQLAAKYPDVTVVNADPRDIEELKNEGISGMDMFVALTEDAATNIVSCMVAREFGVEHTVAQIEDLQYMAEAESLGIGKVVNKKLITSGYILRTLLESDMKVGRLLSLEDVDFVEIEAMEGSRVTRADVKDLKLPRELTFGGMVRGDKVCVVEGTTRIVPGDKLLVAFLPGSLQKVEHWFK